MKRIVIILLFTLTSTMTVGQTVTLLRPAQQHCWQEPIYGPMQHTHEYGVCVMMKEGPWEKHEFKHPNSDGTCPSGYYPGHCNNRGDGLCGKIASERKTPIVGHYTKCSSTGTGQKKSTITFENPLTIREGKPARIQVDGDCTAIKIESTAGKIIAHDTRVCGNGEIQINKRPDADGDDEVIIKAQLDR